MRMTHIDLKMDTLGLFCCIYGIMHGQLHTILIQLCYKSKTTVSIFEQVQNFWELWAESTIVLAMKLVYT